MVEKLQHINVSKLLNNISSSQNYEFSFTIKKIHLSGVMQEYNELMARVSCKTHEIFKSVESFTEAMDAQLIQ